MIAQECKKLREQLEEVAKAEERENVVEQLEARRTELLKLRDAVLAVTNSLKAIARRRELVGNLDPSKCVERVQRIREALKTDPLSITKGRDFSNMKKAFEKFAEDGRAATEATWEQYMPKARPSVDTNQLAQAEQQKDFVTTASQLKTRAKYAEKIGKKPPANEEEFMEIESAWEDIRRMIAELPHVADDPNVQEFLKATNSQSGASLDLLTNEVRAWLAENNVADKYRITTM
jgi:hypothetical protein